MGKRLYVGNLSYDTTEQTLRDFFAQAGDVESVTVLIDRMTNRPRGFGFVEMATDEGGDKAVADLNGQELDGRKLVVNEARPQGDKPRRTGGGGGAGGFRRGGFGGGRGDGGF